MGYKSIQLKLPTDFQDGLLKHKISKALQIRNFTFQIEAKSLDARNKRNIHWLMRIGVFSDELKGEAYSKSLSLEIPHKDRKEKVTVVGSGPAGFFAAYVLQLAGFNTSILERGTDVNTRSSGIERFEQTGVFDTKSNYAFGEGGAGTFSDGKLTSRTKGISLEKRFILAEYIEAGAPKEIAYLNHPHLGSDNLKNIVKNLREKFIFIGGVIHFDCMLEDVTIQNGNVKGVHTSKGDYNTDYLVIASGHSSYETYRMLMRNGVSFRTKNFAIGSRMEHPQQIINKAQWGVENLKGVKAAEYRLKSKGNGKQKVYSFCMCPGGIVVPATAYENANIVNGMSLYQRDAEFANAACVAGIHPDELLGKTAEPLEMLDWMEQLEQSFFNYSNGYKAPACSIADFLKRKNTSKDNRSSYPFGLLEAPLWELLPANIVDAMQNGLKDFNYKMQGFEQGMLIGLESKTSSPIQVIRDEQRKCEGFENLYMIGEGSGYAGGIISSAVDGIKAAMSLINS